MKRAKALLKRSIALSLMLIIVMGVSIGTSTNVLAAAGIVLDRTSGPPGQSIIISGSGFAAGESNIYVTWDSLTVASGISATGGNWSTTIQVPASAAGGSHSIYAIGPISLTVGPVYFNVTPGITLSKTSGPPGSTVTVTGAGFSPNESGINVTFDGTAVGTSTTASSTGTWTTNLTVPATTAGNHSIGAYGTISTSNTVNFLITAGITLSKNSGAPGNSITVNGSGFGTNETSISITFDGNAVVNNITAGSTGAWTSSFIVPQSVAGTHSVGAFGSQTTAITPVSFTTSAGITLSKKSGSPGSAITVNGSGFSSGENNIIITFDGSPVSSGTTAGQTGAWSSSFTVPPSPAGSHSVSAYGSVTAAGTIPLVGFTTVAAVSLNQPAGSPGSAITVSGAGFAANETGITVTFDSKSVASNISANATGSWSTSFVVPAATSGSHVVNASGSVTQAGVVSSANFNIGAGITVNKTSGAPGSAITVTGSGFGANETGITVTYDNNPVASNITANASGSFTSTFMVPPSISGSHTIGASGSITSGSSVNIISFTAGSAISLSEVTGSPGNSVTVDGAGFGAGETRITVTFDNSPVSSNITANSSGSWSANFTVPPAVFGPHVVSASGSITPASPASQSDFTIAPSITLNPTTGFIGSDVRITGSGFAANSQLRVTYDGTEITLQNPSTDAKGNINESISIPVSKAGTHSITTVDAQGNSVKTPFVISNEAPSVPSQIKPKNSSTLSITGNIQPTFEWSAVSDPNGVTYELQIDTTPEFSYPVLDKTDIKANRYTLQPTEALPRGQYYWRVKAIDRASNESDWSPPFALKSGLMAAWLFILLILIGVAAAGAGVFFGVIRPMQRRRATITISEFEAPQFAVGQLPALDTGEASRERQSPPRRLALPEVSKSAKTLSTEDQARLKVIMDFAQSMPLAEPDYGMKWFNELLENQVQTQLTPAAYERLLKGETQVHYEPAWMHHPIYKDLTGMLQRQPILQKLEMFIGDVERCAGDVAGVLQQIQRESGSDLPADYLSRGGWEYLCAVYIDAINWYAGKSLREPSERDYVLEEQQEGASGRWLSGETSTLFAGHLITANDETEAQELKALHLKLRRTWRNNDKTRQIAADITKLQLQRNELINSFSQFGRGK